MIKKILLDLLFIIVGLVILSLLGIHNIAYSTESSVVAIISTFILLLFIYFTILTYIPDDNRNTNLKTAKELVSIFIVIGLLGTLLSLGLSFYGLYTLLGSSEKEITQSLRNLLLNIRLILFQVFLVFILQSGEH